jgi:hypothetical protein
MSRAAKAAKAGRPKGKGSRTRFYIVELWGGSATDNHHGPFSEDEIEEQARRIHRGLEDPENTLLLLARITPRGFELEPMRVSFLEGEDEEE